MVRGLIVKFLQLPIIRNIIRFSKEVRIPGFDGLPLYDVMAFFVKGLQEGWLNLRHPLQKAPLATVGLRAASSSTGAISPP